MSTPNSTQQTSGAIALSPQQGLMANQEKSQALTKISKAPLSTSLREFFKRNVHRILIGIGLGSRFGIEAEKISIGFREVDLAKLHESQSYVSPRNTAFNLLFGDLSKISIVSFSKADELGEEITKTHTTSFVQAYKTSASYRMPTLIEGDYELVLQDAWEQVSAEIQGISQQYAVSAGMDIGANTLPSLQQKSKVEYKDEIVDALERVGTICMNRITNNELLRANYGIQGEDISRIISLFLGSLNATQLTSYTVKDCIGGISESFATNCLEVIVSQIGCEYLYRYPQVDSAGGLRIGPYMLQPNIHLTDLEYANKGIFNYSFVQKSADEGEYLRSVYLYAINNPHETFVIILIDRLLQVLAHIEKMVPVYQKPSQNETLASLFARISKPSRVGYIQTVQDFLQNREFEGIRQLIRVLSAPTKITPEFAGDILAWMQLVEREDGLVNFNDFMHERLGEEGINIKRIPTSSSANAGKFRTFSK